MSELARISIGVDDKGVALMTKVLPQLTAETAKAEAAAKRFTDANGRLREANGRFVKTTTDAASATDRAGKAAQRAGDDFRKMEGAAAKATNAIRNLAGALGVGLTLRELANLSDAYTTMTARLRLVTESEQQRIAVQRTLNGVASRTRNDIAATTDLFVKLRQANEGLGYTTGQTTDLTEAFGLALRVSGASGATATSAIQQFSQAMSKGALTGDEFVTISEAAPEVLRILQQETGKSRAQLLEMREAGELTSKMIADSLLKNLERLRGQIGSAPVTIADGFVALRNSVIKAIGASNDMATAAKNIAEGLAQVGKFLEENGSTLVGLAKMAALAWGATKAIGALRGGLEALNGVSLAGVLTKLSTMRGLFGVVGGGAALAMAGLDFAGNRAADERRQYTERQRDVFSKMTPELLAQTGREYDQRIATLEKSIRTVRDEAGKLLTGSAVQRLQQDLGKLRADRALIAEAGFGMRGSAIRVEGQADAVTATSTSGKSAAQIAKEARQRMLDSLEAAGKEITDGIARRDFDKSVRLNAVVRTLPFLTGTSGTGGVAGDDRAAQKAVAVAQETADRVQSIMAALASGLQQTFSTGLQDLFTNGLSSVERFATSLRDTILRAFSDILASRITARLLGALSSLGGGGAGKIGNIAKGGASGFSFGGALGAGGAGFLLGNAIGARNGSGAGALGGAASGAATGALIGSIVPGLGTVVGGVIGGAAGLLGGLFGGNSRKRKQQDAARALAADAAAFSDELIARTLEASGDASGAAKKRLEIQQAAERAAAAAKFGKTSKAYRDLLDAQAAERAAQEAAGTELGAGTYLAPAGFNPNAYRFDAGRPVATSAPVVTGNEITIVVPEGTTSDQARRILAELERLARAQGLPPNTLPTGSLT